MYHRKSGSFVGYVPKLFPKKKNKKKLRVNLFATNSDTARPTTVECVQIWFPAVHYQVLWGVPVLV